MIKYLYLTFSLVLIYLSAMALYGCSDDNADVPTALCGKWRLAYYGEQSNLNAFNGELIITFHSDSSFDGLEYINHFYGKFKTSGKNILMTLDFIEKSYWEGAELLFTEYMNDVSSFTLFSDNELRLNCKNGYCFIFYKSN